MICTENASGVKWSCNVIYTTWLGTCPRPPACLPTSRAASLRRQQGVGNDLRGSSSARSVGTVGDTTPPATPLSGRNVVQNSSSSNNEPTLPSSAPPCLPGPSAGRRENDDLVEDNGLALPTSPQSQTCSWTSPAPVSHSDNDNENEISSTKMSCEISAVTTPRAAWSPEEDDEKGYRLDGVAAVGGRSSSSNGSSNGYCNGNGNTDDDGINNGSHGNLVHGTQPQGGSGLREDVAVVGHGSRVMSAAAMMSNPCRHHNEGGTDGLVSRPLDDPGVARRPRRAGFGQPSTKVCRPSSLVFYAVRDFLHQTASHFVRIS